MDLLDCLAALNGRDYAHLDGHFNHLQQAFEEGRIAENALIDAFLVSNIMRVDLLPRFLEWVERYPHSYAAHAAAAGSLVSMAWEARQTATADKTADYRFELMHGYLTQAIPLIDKALGLSRAPYLVLTEGIRIQASNVAPVKRDYLAEARKAASGSPWLCRQIIWALNPKWSGSMEAFQHFYEEMSGCDWSEEGRRLLDAAYLTEMGDIALCQEDNEEKALSCCKQAVNICDRPFTYMALGHKLQWTEQVREAEACYLKALSKEPNPDCFFKLGQLREHDLDDHQGAAAAYEKAAEFGHGESAACWAALHLTLEPQDRRDNPALFDKIEAMLKLGMQQYSSDAWLLQAGCYLTGEGVPKNGKEAIPYWIEAAKLGSGIAAKNLGLTYWNGSFGVKQEYDKAFQYMKLAVQLGEEGACANLGRMYYRGHGTKQDYNAARHYLEIGAKAGSSESLADLARIYWLGHGVPSDRQVAGTYLAQLREINEPMYREVNGELNGMIAKLFRGLRGL